MFNLSYSNIFCISIT